MSFWPKKFNTPDDKLPETLAASAILHAGSPHPVQATPVHNPASPPTGPDLTPDELQRAAQASKAVMAVFGEITNVLMRAPNYKNLTLADLEWLVLPAVITGQYSVAEAQSKLNGLLAPLAVLFWASVSPDVDKRITENLSIPIRLTPQDWRSGDIIWIVDVIGDPRVIQAMIKNAAASQWTGRQVKLRKRGPDGAPAIAVLQAAQIAIDGVPA